jgi:proline iminopeptidase
LLDFLFPDFFEDYKRRIPVTEQGDMMAAYYKRLTGDNEEEKLACAEAWVGLPSLSNDHR